LPSPIESPNPPSSVPAVDVSISFGGDDFNLNEMRRLTDKRERFGENALSDDELYTVEKFQAVLRIIGRQIRGRTPQERADKKRGFEIFERLTDEEKEKYSDWTPEQLAAVWPFLKQQRPERDA
jgi:hypothetical protein